MALRGVLGVSTMASSCVYWKENAVVGAVTVEMEAIAASRVCGGQKRASADTAKTTETIDVARHKGARQ